MSGCNVTRCLGPLPPWTRPPNCGPKSLTIVYCGLTSAPRFVVLCPEVREGVTKQQMTYSRPKGERETNPVGLVNCRGNRHCQFDTPHSASASENTCTGHSPSSACSEQPPLPLHPPPTSFRVKGFYFHSSLYRPSHMTLISRYCILLCQVCLTCWAVSSVP